MTTPVRRWTIVLISLAAAVIALRGQAVPGRHGGRLVVAQRSEPKTLNPAAAVDEPSRAVQSLLGAPLIRIHPVTHRTEGVLAESWSVSRDGKQISVRLREGLRFSDGSPVTVEDVIFTYAVHTDPKVGSPQQEALKAGGQPLRVRQAGRRELLFTLSAPFALGERILAGTMILPKHLLEASYQDGRLPSAWGLNTPPAEIAGCGPFRLKSYRPGQKIELERNPHYWKRDRQGKQLPYLDQVDVLFTAGEDAQAARFLAGEADLIAGFGGATYGAIESLRRPTVHLADAGPSLDYTFLLINLNPGTPESRPERRWFERRGFRQALSAAIDREAIARLVYRGRASAIFNPVTPARKLWADQTAAAAAGPAERARALLREEGFRWNAQGELTDARGARVSFTIAANSANPSYLQSAAVIEEDFKKLGIQARVVPLEFRSLVDRVVNRRDFDVAVMALRPGDADPAADMNVFTSKGRTRLWNLSGKPDRGWEAEIDELMAEQLITRDEGRRRELFYRVQRILAREAPLIPLVSPNLLFAAHAKLRNLQPGSLGDLALWNADELFWEP